MSNLAARPVRRLHPPVYPTRLEVLANPEVLRRHSGLPDLFRGEAVPLAAALMAVGLGGCTDPDPSPEARRKAALERVAAAAIVAPIFEHGEGRGSTGCVAVSPPVFLSEEEAIQIIREELTQAGLPMTESDVLMDGVGMPQWELSIDTDWVDGRLDLRRVESATVVPFRVDLQNAQRGVAVEYVSASDEEALDRTFWNSTAQRYDTAGTARRIAERVRSDGRGAFVGVFYDPLPPEVDGPTWQLIQQLAQAFANPNAGRSGGSTVSEDRRPPGGTEHESGEDQARRLLREQVKDFVEWLKGQGVI